MTDPFAHVVHVAPPGWSVVRHAERRWWVQKGQLRVAEMGVIGDAEWWVCPSGDSLPWKRSYVTATTAVINVVSWWSATRPFD